MRKEKRGRKTPNLTSPSSTLRRRRDSPKSTNRKLLKTN